jgi:hypothetical protein
MAQKDSLKSKLIFDADFRFRVEQDWNSRNSQGMYRDDRTRLRYRLRAGLTFQHNQRISAGVRIRTGEPGKQQDSQLTLGDGFKEFGTLPIGFEKAYFKAKWSAFNFWIGKNEFPFAKNNELFWSDNVYPEGITLAKGFQVNSNIIDTMEVRVGHFIIATSNKSLDYDAYFQGFQAYSTFLNKRFELFPSFYIFKNIPNIPDGNETNVIDYSIFHIGSKLKLLNKELLNVEFDYYRNLNDYKQNDSIPDNFKDQKSGVVVGLKYGVQKQRGDWLFKASYARLQQYAAVDFLAQNDWARWDYSSFGSKDGRLTNFNGIELVAGYMIDEKISLKMKYYSVKQLVSYGTSRETGSRIRFDIDYKY